MNLNRHRLRLLGPGFGHMDAQDTILGLSLYAFGVDIVRQYKTSGKRAVDALDANDIFALVGALHFPIAADGDDTVRHGNSDVLLFYVGKLELDEIFVLAFADIGERQPIFACPFIARTSIVRQVERRKSPQRILHFAKWFPMQHGHADSSCYSPQQPMSSYGLRRETP